MIFAQTRRELQLNETRRFARKALGCHFGGRRDSTLPGSCSRPLCCGCRHLPVVGRDGRQRQHGKPKHILVVGAAGGVGRKICKEVCRQIGHGALIVSDYKTARGQELARALGKGVSCRFVDVNDGESIKKAIAGVDAVIVAAQQKEPLVQAICTQYRIVCLDITFSPDFLHKVERLQGKASSQGAVLVVAAGLFPGLSGIMAKYACEICQNVESIDVAMLQNTNASAGPTGIADMLGLFAQPVTFRKDGAQ